MGWLDSLARLKNFYTGQLRQSRQPLGVPYGSLDCLIARFFLFLCPLKSRIFVNYVRCC